MTVVALIPALNEADSIAATVTAVATVESIDRIIVIDDGSSDSTARLAAAAGAEVLSLPRTVGKGAALDAGYAHVRDSVDVLVLLDGDLDETADQGERLIGPVLRGNADMTIATFPPPLGKAGFGLVKGLARVGIRLLGGDAFSPAAPLSGQRAIASSALEAVTPFAFGYGVEVALTVRAMRAGLRVLEVPTTMSHAATGRDIAGFSHRGRQFAHVAMALVRLAFEHRG